LKEQQLSFDNWECEEAIDFDKMIQHIVQTKKQLQAEKKVGFIFVEGFLLYTNPNLNQLFDQKYFIVIPRDICHKRRADINLLWKYPEPNFEQYFEHVIWPSYLKYNSHVPNQKDTIMLDGQNTIENLFSEITNYLLGSTA